MDIFSGLLNGFAIALTGTNILFAFLGALIGTAIGVLPGLGPAATIALLLPIAKDEARAIATGALLLVALHPMVRHNSVFPEIGSPV